MVSLSVLITLFPFPTSVICRIAQLFHFTAIFEDCSPTFLKYEPYFVKDYISIYVCILYIYIYITRVHEVNTCNILSHFLYIYRVSKHIYMLGEHISKSCVHTL